VLSEAESRAKALVAEAESRAAALLGDAENRLTQIRSERESVAGYIENLRSVLAQAESVTAEHGFPVAPRDEPEALRVEPAVEEAAGETSDETVDQDAEAREPEHAG